MIKLFVYGFLLLTIAVGLQSMLIDDVSADHSQSVSIETQSDLYCDVLSQPVNEADDSDVVASYSTDQFTMSNVGPETKHCYTWTECYYITIVGSDGVSRSIRVCTIRTACW